MQVVIEVNLTSRQRCARPARWCGSTSCITKVRSSFVWARVHKIDRIRPQPGGGAIVLVEDERNVATMSRLPSLSTLIATARILNARRLLEARYAGIGEIRYAAGVQPPSFLVDAIIRAGASLCDGRGERVIMPASPGSVSAVVDLAFSELAHHVRWTIGAPNVIAALRTSETQRRKKPLDRDAQPAAYWTAVFELTALAGELSRSRGGRWIDTKDMPVPFAVRFPKGELAHPANLAQQIALGSEPTESLEDNAEAPVPIQPPAAEPAAD
jgi:hypothetical protein